MSIAVQKTIASILESTGKIDNCYYGVEVLPLPNREDNIIPCYTDGKEWIPIEYKDDESVAYVRELNGRRYEWVDTGSGAFMDHRVISIYRVVIFKREWVGDLDTAQANFTAIMSNYSLYRTWTDKVRLSQEEGIYKQLPWSYGCLYYGFDIVDKTIVTGTLPPGTGPEGCGGIVW
jgi:hypothetical protein